MEKLKDALKKAFDATTNKSTAAEIFKKAEEMIDPTCKGDLLEVAYAINHEPLFVAVKELSPNRDFTLNSVTLKLIYKMLLEQFGFNPLKAREILNTLKYAKNLDKYDITLVTLPTVDNSTPSDNEDVNKLGQPSNEKKQSGGNKGNKKAEKEQKTRGNTGHKIRRKQNKESLRELEALYNTSLLKFLYLGSYVLIFLLWSAVVVIIFGHNDWRMMLASGGVSTMLTLVASKIIPLIKQSYERSMTFLELSCFILKVKGENSEDTATYEIEMPGLKYNSNGGCDT